MKRLVQESCKTCARIPVHLLDRSIDDSRVGGILKVDYKTNTSCLDGCIDPNVIPTPTPTPTPPSTTSPSTSTNSTRFINASRSSLGDTLGIAHLLIIVFVIGMGMISLE